MVATLTLVTVLVPSINYLIGAALVLTVVRVCCPKPPMPVKKRGVLQWQSIRLGTAAVFG